MEICTPWRCCQAGRSHLLHLTTLLLLSLVLPTSSAQDTTSLTPTPRSPTTLSTSAIPSSTPISVPDTTQSDPSSTSLSSTSSSTTEASHAFNYYFLIIAAAVIFISFCVLYIGRQKKRKAVLMQTRGQRALARDVEGWRARFGVRRPGVYTNHTSDADVEDGLDERGEAPPPYVPGSKPPSIGSDELQRPNTAVSPPVRAEPVELSNMSPNASPPGYSEQFSLGSQNTSPEITRPGPVVTASERYSPVRRSPTTTGSP